MVAAPLLPESGDAVVGVRFHQDPFAYGAVGADLVLFEREGRLHLVPAAEAVVEPVRSVDRSRRLAKVDADAEPIDADLAREWPMDAIALEQHGVGLGIGEIIDRDQLQPAVRPLQDGARPAHRVGGVLARDGVLHLVEAHEPQAGEDAVRPVDALASRGGRRRDAVDPRDGAA